MEILEITEYSDQVLQSLNELLPQLSASFEALSRSDLEQIVESQATTLFMAKENSQYVGSLTLVRFDIPSGARAWIEDVVVSDTARGKGVGKQLVNHAVTVANQSNVKSIDLTARSTRVAALVLYKKCGFINRDTNVLRHQSS